MSDPKELKTHPASLTDQELLSGCQIELTRRGGPGGQHRNRTETAVVITHLDSGVSGQASERRSQKDNREKAMFRLRLNLAVAVRTPKLTDDESVLPNPTWQSRAVGSRIQVSVNHRDFPALVAEALDWVAAYRFDFSLAAKQLKLSVSQLVKFLKLCPEAWQMVQQKRFDVGLPRLK